MQRDLYRIWILLFLVGPGARMLHAAPSAETILRRAAEAARRVPYCGVRMTILWLENRTEGIECIEYADGQGRFRVEYLAPRSAKGRVIIDDGKSRWQLEAGARQVLRLAHDPLPQEEPWNIALLFQNYRISLEARPHIVAHRRAYKLTLRPKHPGKPFKIWWVDTQNYLILKREARHADGSPARSSAFSEITLNPKTPPSKFKFRPSKGMRIIFKDTSSRWQNAPSASRFMGTFLPQRLPSLGFTLHGALCKEEKGKRTVHLLYEDGLATLSVFVDQQPRQAAMKNAQNISLQGKPAWLKTDHHFTILRWAKQGYRYTIVGDLTPAAILAAGADFIKKVRR